MSTPDCVPEASVSLPPSDADVISTACDYCIFACGYEVYRWPGAGGKVGGPKAAENAFNEDFPVNPLGPWIAPTQHNIVLHNGEPHHVVIIPDKDTEFVNYNFGPSYDDWAEAETLLICGTDPYESKTILFTDFIMPAIQNGQKTIFLLPRRTGGVAYAEKNGGLLLDIQPGTDPPVMLAIARVIVEAGWEDSEWIQQWVNNKWESSSGFGQGTRNTPWQWRTAWGKFQTKGFEDWKEWLLAQDYSKLEVAAEMAQIDVQKIYTATDWTAISVAATTSIARSLMVMIRFPNPGRRGREVSLEGGLGMKRRLSEERIIPRH